MTAMTEIILPFAPDSRVQPGQTAADPVCITISVEGGLAPAVLAHLRRSLPAACRITLHETRPDLTEITARQRQILQLLSQDLSNKDIGRRLGLSHFTVRNHVSQLLRLLGVPSRKAATGVIRRMALGGHGAGDWSARDGDATGAPATGPFALHA